MVVEIAPFVALMILERLAFPELALLQILPLLGVLMLHVLLLAVPTIMLMGCGMTEPEPLRYLRNLSEGFESHTALLKSIWTAT